MMKLLATGKTDLLEKFVSNAHATSVQGLPRLGQGSREGQLRVCAVEVSSRGPRAAARPAREAAAAGPAPAKKVSARGKASKAAKSGAPKAPRKSTGKPMTPSAELAAVIGTEPVARTEVIKKLWDYIKANGLQDATNKRAINADARLLPIFGKPQVTMFELAKVVGPHLSA